MSYIDFGVFLFPNSSYDELYPKKDKDGITPQTRTLSFCMFTCGIQKLFNRHDLYELIFRLSIAHKHLNVLDNFFGDDYLFDFKTEDNIYRITTEDLIAHLGLYITSNPDKENSFEKWQQYIRNHWTSGLYIAGLLNFSVPGLEKLTERKDDNVLSLEMAQLEEPPTEEIVNNARILAENFIKDIPEEPFIIFARQNEERLKEIDEYIAFANSPLPVSYSWESLSDEAKQGIRSHFAWLFDEPVDENTTIDDIDQQFGQPISKLVYLAWIVANDYNYELALGDFDPRIKIDIFDYEIFEDDIGVNLQNVYERYELDELKPLLKN